MFSHVEAARLVEKKSILSSFFFLFFIEALLVSGSEGLCCRCAIPIPPSFNLRKIPAIPTHPSTWNFWHDVNVGSSELHTRTHKRTRARFWFLPSYASWPTTRLTQSAASEPLRNWACVLLPFNQTEKIERELPFVGIFSPHRLSWLHHPTRLSPSRQLLCFPSPLQPPSFLNMDAVRCCHPEVFVIIT